MGWVYLELSVRQTRLTSQIKWQTKLRTVSRLPSLFSLSRLNNWPHPKPQRREVNSWYPLEAYLVFSPFFRMVNWYLAVTGRMEFLEQICCTRKHSNDLYSLHYCHLGKFGNTILHSHGFWHKKKGCTHLHHFSEARDWDQGLCTWKWVPQVQVDWKL